MDKYSDMPDITKEYCQPYIDHLIQIQMKDGRFFQAILIDVDDRNATVLVDDPEYQMTREETDERFFGPRFYPGYRFRRLFLPLAGIVALSTLPYFFQPYYPYPPYYPYF